MQYTPQQLKKLEKLAKVLDNGDVELLTQLNELEDKVDSEIEEIKSVVNETISVVEQTKKMKGDDGYTPVKGVDYFDGEDGVDYILTESDKKQIAKSITVPVVEKVIEKTIIKETPIVTNEIVERTVEVAVLDEAIVGYLEDEIKRVEGIASTKQHTNFGRVVRELQAGNNITIDNTDPNRPIVASTASGGGNIDGGDANDVYLASMTIDGGASS